MKMPFLIAECGLRIAEFEGTIQTSNGMEQSPWYRMETLCAMPFPVWVLVVITAAAGSFLRPFPLVVFTAKFLPDHWISHIEKAE